jgi:hypothetical protein
MYNFDESGYMMGMVSTGAVIKGPDRQGWLKSVQHGN